MSDVERLRAVAEGATPGPWAYANENDHPFGSFWHVTNEAFHNPPADEDAPWLSMELYTGVEADAAHIATFDPPTVLGLLDRLAAAEAKVARVEALIDPERGMAILPYGAGRRFFDGADIRAALTEEA